MYNHLLIAKIICKCGKVQIFLKNSNKSKLY